MVASSELQELLALCDRIAVMSAGRMISTFERDSFDQEKILEAAFSAHNTTQMA